jgi:cytochrome c oxidase subunit IV
MIIFAVVFGAFFILSAFSILVEKIGAGYFLLMCVIILVSWISWVLSGNP